MAPARIQLKITILGDGGVGKTALTVQFTMSSFVETYDPTIEDCYRKQWVVDDQPYLLEVLDTAGQEEYTALRDQWIRDGEGFLIVYSICKRSTFDVVERMIDRVQQVKDEANHQTSYSPYGQKHNPYQSHQLRKKIPVVIVGNKKDLYNSREVSTDEGRRLAKRTGCDFYETSAKQGSNVEAAFKSLVREMKLSMGGVTPSGGNVGGSGGGGRRRHKRACVIL